MNRNSDSRRKVKILIPEKSAIFWKIFAGNERKNRTKSYGLYLGFKYFILKKIFCFSNDDVYKCTYRLVIGKYSEKSFRFTEIHFQFEIFNLRKNLYRSNFHQFFVSFDQIKKKETKLHAVKGFSVY